MEINVNNQLTDIDRFFPTTDTSDMSWGLNTAELERQALAIEIMKCIRRKDYSKGIEAITQMIDQTRQMMENGQGYFLEDELMEIYQVRAGFYVGAGQLDEAFNDIQWIKSHATMYSGKNIESAIWMIQILQGNTGSELQIAANRGDRLARLLLNEGENTSPIPAAILALAPEQRIQKLFADGYYGQAIEEINRYRNEWHMNHPWQSFDQWTALRGACYALRGNFFQAMTDYSEVNHYRYYREFENEMAYVCAMAGHPEKGVEILDKDKNIDPSKICVKELLIQLIELKAGKV
jgi:tetratricopeptide (TPR) repeat protein